MPLPYNVYARIGRHTVTAIVVGLHANTVASTEGRPGLVQHHAEMGGVDTALWLRCVYKEYSDLIISS